MSEQKRKTIRDWDPDQPVVREESIDFVLAKTAGSLLKLQIADMDLDGYDEMCLVPVQTGCLRPIFAILLKNPVCYASIWGIWSR